MALSGSNTNNFASGFGLKLNWSATQNIANNQSTITVKIYLSLSNANIGVNARSDGSITIDGVAETRSYNAVSEPYRVTKDVLLAQWSRTINHNSNGTKSFTASASYPIRATLNGVYYERVTVSASGTLTTIPRYAAITSFSASISGLTASLSWKADKTISQWRYSTNSGTSYTGWISANATSGSTSFGVSASTTYGFRIQVRSSESGLDTTSSVLSRTSPSSGAITKFTVSINDFSANISWTADKTISQWRYSTNSGTSYTGWTTVNAKSGSKSSISVSPGSTYGFRIQVKDTETGLTTTSSVVNKTATKTPSTLTLSTTSQNVGSGIKWTVNESYNYTHKITYSFGNTSGYILGSGSAASNTATDTWTVPTSLANQIPNATSGSGTISVYTYYGSTHIGTKSYSFTAKVPNDETYQPTATISSVAQGTTLPSGITAFVQNHSKAKVRSTGTPKYSATIKTYSVSVAGIGTYTGSVITSDFLKNSGNVRVTLTVTDSRGLKGSTYEDITVFPYSPPQLAFRAWRNEDNPKNIEVNFEGSISPINNQNYKYYRIRLKESGASDTLYYEAIDSYEHYTFDKTETISSDESYTIDLDKSYTIEFFVKDSFTSITRTFQVGTAFTLMDFHETGKAMAIGKISEGNGFEVGMPTTIFNTQPNVLTLKRSSEWANVNLVFENNELTRYISFKQTGRPAWAVDADVNLHGYNFWTDENVIYGSNSNGQYIQFPNGIVIMMITTTAALAYSKAVTATITLPSSVINTSYKVQLSYAYDLPDAIRGKTTVHARNKTTSSFGIVMQTQDAFFDTTNASDVRIDCVIYGRWE